MKGDDNAAIYCPCVIQYTFWVAIHSNVIFSQKYWKRLSLLMPQIVLNKNKNLHNILFFVLLNIRKLRNISYKVLTFPKLSRAHVMFLIITYYICFIRQNEKYFPFSFQVWQHRMHFSLRKKGKITIIFRDDLKSVSVLKNYL